MNSNVGNEATQAAAEAAENEIRVTDKRRVTAEGELIASPASGQRFEIRADRVTVVGPVGDDYPVQKKRHSFEFQRTLGHLRMRTNTFGSARKFTSRTVPDTDVDPLGAAISASAMKVVGANTLPAKSARISWMP